MKTAPSFGFGADRVNLETTSSRSEFLGTNAKKSMRVVGPGSYAPTRKKKMISFTVPKDTRECNKALYEANVGPMQYSYCDSFGHQIDSRKRTAPGFRF